MPHHSAALSLAAQNHAIIDMVYCFAATGRFVRSAWARVPVAGQTHCSSKQDLCWSQIAASRNHTGLVCFRSLAAGTGSLQLTMARTRALPFRSAILALLQRGLSASPICILLCVHAQQDRHFSRTVMVVFHKTCVEAGEAHDTADGVAAAQEGEHEPCRSGQRLATCPDKAVLHCRAAALMNAGLVDEPDLAAHKPRITVLRKKGRRIIENTDDIVNRLMARFTSAEVAVLDGDDIAVMSIPKQVSCIKLQSRICAESYLACCPNLLPLPVCHIIEPLLKLVQMPEQQLAPVCP